MRFVRTFEDMNGLFQWDYGETPEEQIHTMKQCWIESDTGEILMEDGTSDKYMVKQLASLVPNQGKVLEIGYGMGFSFAEIRKKVPTHDVCDMEPGAFEIGRSHFPHRYDDHGRRIEGDFKTALSSVSNSFYDAIYIDAVSEVHKDRDGLDELLRLLRQGGFLIPFVHAKKRTDLPRIRGCTRDKVIEYSYLNGDPNYEHNISLVLKRTGQMHRLSELLQKFEHRNRVRGFFARWKKKS